MLRKKEWLPSHMAVARLDTLQSSCHQATPSSVCDMIANTTENAVSPVPIRMIHVSLDDFIWEHRTLKYKASSCCYMLLEKVPQELLYQPKHKKSCWIEWRAVPAGNKRQEMAS